MKDKQFAKKLYSSRLKGSKHSPIATIQEIDDAQYAIIICNCGWYSDTCENFEVAGFQFDLHFKKENK